MKKRSKPKALLENAFASAKALRHQRTPRSKSNFTANVPADRKTSTFPIVGIGASAGGLEAFTRLLKHLPVDTGFGFVLVQHLDPQHESALTQLLSRVSLMPVQEVTNNLRVKANHIYVIPPNTNLSIARGVLKLQPREPARTSTHSIDAFFQSLAHDQHQGAIGVILSGTATDGTVGLEVIKAEGGITFAQDASAKYDSMPRSAIAASCVDFVLSPENIAKELARIARHPFVRGTHSPRRDDDGQRALKRQSRAPEPVGGTPTGTREAGVLQNQPISEQNTFKKILLLLRHHCGVDFLLYKPATIQRRITRRMVLNKQDTLDDYARFLRGNTRELNALYSDALISVTSFFRNPEAFDILQRKVFPKFFQERGDDPFRVWVLGCSTGQEAYSIAMAFVECAENAPRTRKLQMFATDVNEALLEKARHGLYSKGVAQDVSPERLRRFFVEEEGGYRVNKALREMIVFARQNIISDPPFSRMDLISCRNLLIYLEPGLQKRAMPSFHYALRPDGFLLLGASESIGGCTELFDPVDKKHKIYSRKAAPTPAFHLPATRKNGERQLESTLQRASDADSLKPSFQQAEPPEGYRAELSAQREADRVTLNQFAPPGVLINARLQILQFRGATSPFLEPPTGKATFDVLKMAREGLMLPLRAAIHKAKKENRIARKESVRVKQNGHTRTVNLEVIPLKNLRESCFLILFEEAGDQKALAPAFSLAMGEGESPVAGRRGRGRQGNRSRGAPKAREPDDAPPSPEGESRGEGERSKTRAESRRISELETELTETCEYLQSVQEQHEAANEELQAANEEVQSANEELQSINEELETSKEELESANEELSTVNEEMANRNAELNRLNSDLGNLQTSTKLAIVLLGRDLTIRRFSAQAEKQFNLLAGDVGRPIGNVRHNLVFPTASSQREVASSLSPQRRSGERGLQGTGQENRPSSPRHSPSSDEGEGVELRHGEGGRSLQLQPHELEALLREVIDTVREQEREVQDGDGRWYSLRVRPYLTLDNKVDGAVLVLVDIDAFKRGEREAKVARDYAEAILRTARDPLVVLRADLRVNTANEAFCKMFRTTPDQVKGNSIFELAGGAWRNPLLRASFDEILRQNSSFNDFEITHDFSHIGQRILLLNARRLDLDDRAPPVILLAIEDVTERRRQDAASLAAIVDSSDDAILGKDLNGVIRSWNKGAERLFGYTAQEAIGQPVTMLIPPDRRREEPEILARLRRGERVDQFETVRVRKDGSQLEISLTVSPIKDATGQVIGASKIARDITRRKQADEALRRAAEFDEAVMTNMGEGLYTVDSQGLVTFMNPAAERLFGWSLSELRGRKMHDPTHHHHPDGTSFPAEECAGLQVLKKGETLTGREDVFIRKDGTFFDVVYSSSPLREGDKITGLVVVFRDVTERKRIEDALRQAQTQLAYRAGQLEQVVAERTIELREANNHLEAFVYSIAHDLRRPVRAMQGLAQTLLEEYGPGLEETGRSYAARIERSARLMDRLLLDLLEFSRMSHVAMPLESVRIDRVLEEALRHCEAEIQEKQARVEVIPPLPSVHAHAPALGQVLTNLLTNAIKFVAPGVRPSVRIRAEEKPETVRVWVEDNGIGIPAEFQERIFHIFERLHGTAYPGTGIGLTIVRKGAERMGGSAGVESVPGEGSRFWIELAKTRPDESGTNS